MTTFPELREALTVRLHKIVADPMLCDDYCNAMIEAADTIEAQAAEIERLREALEGALSLSVGWAANYQHMHKLPEFHPTHAAIIAAARAALEQTK